METSDPNTGNAKADEVVARIAEFSRALFGENIVIINATGPEPHEISSFDDAA